jgi:leucyl-tRNA synthetase
MKTSETRVKQNPRPGNELPYRPDEVEARWQARWAERRTNEPDLDRASRPF